MSHDSVDAEKQYESSNAHIERLAKTTTQATYIEPSHVDELSAEHRAYLLQRHGTLELDPIPGHGDADPYNWSTSKVSPLVHSRAYANGYSQKTINLLLVAFHAMMATFTASSIQSAFGNIAEDFGHSIQSTSYLTSLFICILGVAPLFWQPISKRYGRRPVFLLSLVFSAVGNM